MSDTNNLRAKMGRRVSADAKPARTVLSQTSEDVRRMTIYLPAEDATALKILAAEQGTSMSALISAEVKALLQREER